MKPTFENTVSTLVKAFLNDTLEHTNCHACAVGNLVSEANKIPFTRTEHGSLIWKYGFAYWYSPMWLGEVNYESCEISKAQQQIQATGYSLKELARIENAFESATCSKQEPEPNDVEWMFNGLMAVVDVLADIHGVDLTTKESAKALFVKTPVL